MIYQSKASQFQKEEEVIDSEQEDLLLACHLRQSFQHQGEKASNKATSFDEKLCLSYIAENLPRSVGCGVRLLIYRYFLRARSEDVKKG
jgi:hypothetical protein